MTTVAIMQPTYLGWCGYFDLIDQADVFVLLDTVAVNTKSWQMRNQIRNRNGDVVWLSVPTNAKRGMPLSHVQIDNSNGWRQKHLCTLDAAYGHAPHYATVRDIVEYGEEPAFLSYYTSALVVDIARTLGCEGKIWSATSMHMAGMDITDTDPFERIRDICRHAGATELLNTPGAKEWMEGHDVGVPVRWHQYEHPEYTQGNAPFCSHLSVVDVLAWHGPEALRIIRSGRRNA